MGKVRIGIIEEGKLPADERAPFSPEQCKFLMNNYPCEVIVQKSRVRRIPDSSYEKEGIQLADNLGNCDFIFGIKEIPLERLKEGMTYIFFSHTIKKQAHNKKLLQKVLEGRIKLIDYECMVDSKGLRLLGFGKYAGIVGTYNGLRMIGLKEKSFSIKKAYDCADESEMLSELTKVKLTPIKICLTGMGRVSSGALQILRKIGIRQVEPESYLNETFEEAVFCLLDVTDYNKKPDGSRGEMFDFFHHPETYVTDFSRFAFVTDFYIACHFWHPKSPLIIDPSLLKDKNFRILYISDISCDVGGPIASTIRSSTIEKPFYGILLGNLSESDYMDKSAIAVMAVDNLPCELPVNASRDFGDQLIAQVIPSLFNGDKDGILDRATIAADGKLTKRFEYLMDYSQ